MPLTRRHAKPCLLRQTFLFSGLRHRFSFISAAIVYDVGERATVCEEERKRSHAVTSPHRWLSHHLSSLPSMEI